MKKYLLFSGAVYYPEGGWNDFISDFDTIEEVIERCTSFIKNSAWRDGEWYQIVDTETMKEINIDLSKIS